jgi:hypothetical protein
VWWASLKVIITSTYLAYGMVSDAMDEYYFLRESTTMLINLKWFVKAMKGVGFKEKYLQFPTRINLDKEKCINFWHGFSKDGHVVKLFALLLEELLHHLVLERSFLLYLKKHLMEKGIVWYVMK